MGIITILFFDFKGDCNFTQYPFTIVHYRFKFQKHKRDKEIWRCEGVKLWLLGRYKHPLIFAYIYITSNETLHQYNHTILLFIVSFSKLHILMLNYFFSSVIYFKYRWHLLNPFYVDFSSSFTSPRFLLCTHRLIWKGITEINNTFKLNCFSS